MSKFIVGLCLFIVAQVGSAETTVEFLQRKADGGDATAQTLLGLMHFYGYRFERNYDQAEEWYEKGVKNGDAFAGERLRSIQKTSRASRKKARGSSQGKPNSYSEILKKASVAEREGDVTAEDIIRNGSDFEGKVVRLRCFGGSFHWGSDRMSLFGNDFDLYVYVNLPPDNQEAIDWAVERDKNDGASSSVYLYVEQPDRLYLLGTKKRKSENGYAYTW